MTYKLNTTRTRHFRLLLAGGALSAFLAAMASGQTVCEGVMYYADELGAPGFSPPGTSYKGYFTSDIGMDGDGDLAIVGEYNGGGDENGPGDGLARIYSHASGSWLQTHAFQHDESEEDDRFGLSVDIDGDFAIIAAPRRDDEPNDDRGAAYLFKYESNDDEWDQQQEILNPGNSTDDFGGHGGQHEGVALDGRFAAVSAVTETAGSVSNAGVVYMYVYDSAQDMWVLEDTITSPIPQDGGRFGYSIEISGERIIVGAFNQDSTEIPNTGVAYIFKRSQLGTDEFEWTLEDTLFASNPMPGDQFGRSVSIDGNAAAVGAPGGEITFVYGYNASAGEWQFYDDLSPQPGSNHDFGINVSLRSSLLLVGARLYSDSTYVGGAAYVFQRGVGEWNQSALLVADPNSIPLGDDRIGETLALGSDEAFIGASSHDLEPDPQDPTGTQEGVADLLRCAGL